MNCRWACSANSRSPPVTALLKHCDRSSRSKRLTRADKQFLEHVPRIFTALQQARDSVRAAANGFHGQQRIARKFIAVAYDIPSKCVATYFPEANVLIPVNRYARESKTPISKSVIIKVKKAVEVILI